MIDDLSLGRVKLVERITELEVYERRWKLQRGENGYGKCPMCKADLDADEVDNGVGMQQVGPAYCPCCLGYPNDDGTFHPGPAWVDSAEADALKAKVKELFDAGLNSPGWDAALAELDEMAASW